MNNPNNSKEILLEAGIPDTEEVRKFLKTLLEVSNVAPSKDLNALISETRVYWRNIYHNPNFYVNK